MLSHAKVLLPLLAVVVAILVATVEPPGLFSSYLGSPSASLSSHSTPMSDRSVDIDGVSFPVDVKVAGAKQSLIGGGTRSKWGFRVYALGVYADPKLTRTLKKKHPSSTSTSTSGLSSDFAESKLARTLLLRFRRGVASSDVSDALGEALADRLGEEKSDEFSRFVLNVAGSDRLEKGSDLWITCKGERLWASLTGEDGKDGVKAISMKGLCSAIFEVYLGSSPVSQQVKDGFEKGFAELTVG